MQSDIMLTTGIEASVLERYNLHKKRRFGETVIETSLVLCGITSIFTTIGIVVVLMSTALDFFTRPEVRLFDFLTWISWQPRIGDFGIWPLLTMTLMIGVISVIFALPIGLMIAIYLSEYASPRIRSAIKPVLEVLAGVPTVVYGYFALTFVTPIVRNVFGTDTVEIYNVLSAGLVVGVLILPLVTTMSEDAFHAVPRSLREAAYGLGARKLETSTRIVLPAATSGLVAAFMVSVSRAVGETMVVALAAGAGPRNFPSWKDSLTNLALFNPFKAGETMTGHMVRISGGDLSYNSVDYESIFAIGLVLFVVTLVLNVIARRVVQRYREVYE